MGDVPYTENEKKLLKRQLNDMEADEAAEGANDGDALFAVHIGDIFTTREFDCVPDSYTDVSDIFTKHSHLPTFVLPGDNEWVDCKNENKAFQMWEDNFLAFEKHWNTTSHLPSRVSRMRDRQANFAFRERDVLFLGLNIIGGIKGGGRDNDWDNREADCLEWSRDQLSRHTDVRAVIVFGHADKNPNVFEMIAKRAKNMDVPALYVHGSGHTWSLDHPISNIPNYWKVQVDQGGHAPPVKVTVRGTTDHDKYVKPFAEENTDQFVLDGMLKVDRRGGLYSWVR